MKLSAIFRASAVIFCLSGMGLAIAPMALANSPAEQQTEVTLVVDWVKKGDDLVAKDAFREAIAAYGEAIKLMPDSANAYGQRANAYLLLEDWKNALADCGKVVALGDEAELKTIYLTQSQAYDGLKDFRQAVTALDNHLSRNGEDAFGYYLRGKGYDDLGDRDRAMKDLERSKALATAQKDANVLTLLKTHAFLKTVK
jgi:tetratricopeptide (TPR) repeat protein